MTPSRPKIYRTAAAIRLLGLLATGIALLELAGCATTSPPFAQIAAADSSIRVADEDGQKYAAAELASAHSEMAMARAAMKRQDYEKAQTLAATAQADADLASAKGRAMAAQSAVAAKTEDNETLRRRLLNQEPLK